MNVTQENIDALNAKIKIEITPDDYAKPVETVLDNYRKKMNLQGFRPGKVPFGVAKKMYGKAVLAEELNKILSEKLTAHIRDNKLNILGQPLPHELGELSLDFDKKLEFTYDLGLAPSFSVDLSKEKFNKYTITVDSDLVEKYVRDFQRRYGKSEEVDTVTEKDMIYGTFHELDKDGNHKHGGHHNHTTIVVEYVESKDSKAKLIGMKVGDRTKVEPAKLSKGDADLSAMLNIPVSELGKQNKLWELSVESIHRIEPHALDKALFDKVLGPNVAETEAEFREKISSDLGKHLATDSDKKLKRDINDTLLDKLKLQLPDAFLKRWLLQTGKDNNGQALTQADIDREYDDYSRFIKLQLIENEIAKKQDIKVDANEINDRVKANIKAQFASFGQQELPEDMMNRFAENFMQREEEVRKVFDQLMEEKLMAYYTATVKLQEKEVTFDEFVKLASAKPSKGGFINQVSNLLKF